MHLWKALGLGRIVCYEIKLHIYKKVLHYTSPLQEKTCCCKVSCGYTGYMSHWLHLACDNVTFLQFNCKINNSWMNELYWKLPSGCDRWLLAITYYNPVDVTENHLHFLTSHNIHVNTFSKHLQNFVYMFTKLHVHTQPSTCCSNNQKYPKSCFDTYDWGHILC